MAKASDFEGKKPDDLFYFVDYSPEEAERVGYSNYSYWGSVSSRTSSSTKSLSSAWCCSCSWSCSPSSRWPSASIDYTTLITDFQQGVHQAQQ